MRASIFNNVCLFVPEYLLKFLFFDALYEWDLDICYSVFQYIVSLKQTSTNLCGTFKSPEIIKVILERFKYVYKRNPDLF